MKAALSNVLFRLRNDFQLSMISVLGAIGVLAILPFSLLRFWQGNPVAGTADLLVASAICGSALYAWRSGKLDRAGVIIALCNTAGSLAVEVLLGKPGLYWMYVAMLANFFIVGRNIAVSLALAGIALAQFIPGAFDDPVQRASVITTQLLVALFAFIFAHRTAIQHQMLERLATHDALTGARNRRALEQELDIAMATGARQMRPSALLLLDLDHFKQVNDRYGHEAGDQVLCQFVDLIHAHTRAGDRLFRYGGEEFVLLLENTGIAGAQAAFAKLQALVHARLRIQQMPVTISAGAAALHPGETREQWLARADAALYRAKQNGRDRLEIAD
ncbi:GGDEF domain-containing protein [Thermomonas alba]|uniref:GGDEF domain-containing protein n=1 Tax=Thermomonas alba TaxID=2888525 RepID=UPI001F04ABEB|nr:GGDEF domain-containing protein [Thermomonas alba]